MDPTRVSFDASAYPTLAEVVLRHVDLETRLTLRAVSQSWFKEAMRGLCTDVVIRPSRCAWRGFKVYLHTPGLSNFSREVFYRNWDEYSSEAINERFGYCEDSNDTPSTDTGRPLEITDDDENHERKLFYSVRPRRAVFLRLLEEALYGCKTLTVDRPLSPASHRFLQRYKFDSIRFNKTSLGDDNVLEIPLSAPNVRIEFSLPWVKYSQRSETVIKIPNGVMTLTIEAEFHNYGGGSTGSDAAWRAPGAQSKQDIQRRSAHLLSKKGLYRKRADAKLDVETFPYLQKPDTLRHVCVYFREDSWKQTAPWVPSLRLDFLRRLLRSVLCSHPCTQFTFVNLPSLMLPKPLYTTGPLSVTNNLLLRLLFALRVGPVDFVAGWLVWDNSQLDRAVVTEALGRVEVLHEKEYRRRERRRQRAALKHW